MNFHIEKAKVLPKANLSLFLEGLTKEFKVIAPLREGKAVKFKELKETSKLELSYTRTILPPKKYLLPYRRERFTYSPDDLSFEETTKIEPQVIFGIHPCDLHGISILDAIYLGEPPDPNYLNVRDKTYLIGISCMPDDYCFCLSTGTAFPEGASWELFLTDIGSDYFVSIGSPKGDELVIKFKELFRDIEKEDLELYKRSSIKKKRAFKESQLPDLERISQLVELEYESSVWEEEASGCFCCGTCTNVCPTCFCYTTLDIPDLEGKRIKRLELITSCQYPEYSLVAGGHYFKPKRADRFKHRYYHKLVGYPYQIGKLGCVGCGRCSYYCPAKISMVKTIKKLRGVDEEELREAVK
ncbi:4Fe-4S dicluster domain-containing protein [Thermovibrio sp.]